MAHRGRLNVLVNVLGKSPQDLFSEFEGAYDLARLKGSGDVKYHKGYSADVRTPGGNVHIALAFNPSHLEIVNPVVEGSVRARQDRRGDSLGEQVLPVLIHGDAAFAGQGVVAETFQLSQTRAFYTGGTVHLVINNQIGFTMSDPRDSRSTTLLLGHREDGRGARVPRERRRSRSGRRGRAARAALPAGVPQGRRDRPRRLSPARSQRSRRAVRDAAADVRRDSRAPERAHALRAASSPKPASSPRKSSSKLADDYRNALDEGRNPNQAALGMIGNQYTVDWSRYHQAALGDSVATGCPRRSSRGSPTLVNTVPADSQAASARAADHGRPRAAWRRARSAATGVSPRRSPTRRCSPPTSTCGSSAKTAGAARSSTATPR